MSSRRTAAPEAALIPLFVGQHGCSVSFVVDTSEDMRAVLGSVKHLLIQALLTKASLQDSLFNIMTFSGEVRRLLTSPSVKERQMSDDVSAAALLFKIQS